MNKLIIVVLSSFELLKTASRWEWITFLTINIGNKTIGLEVTEKCPLQIESFLIWPHNEQNYLLPQTLSDNKNREFIRYNKWRFSHRKKVGKEVGNWTHGQGSFPARKVISQVVILGFIIAIRVPYLVLQCKLTFWPLKNYAKPPKLLKNQLCWPKSLALIWSQLLL